MNDAPAPSVTISVTGPASPEDVAAILTVLAAASGDGAEQSPAKSLWADRGRLLRRPLPHGRGVWPGSLR